MRKETVAAVDYSSSAVDVRVSSELALVCLRIFIVLFKILENRLLVPGLVHMDYNSQSTVLFF